VLLHVSLHAGDACRQRHTGVRGKHTEYNA
jgi:hypothetical protein